MTAESGVGSTRDSAASDFGSGSPGAVSECPPKFQLKVIVRNRWGDPFKGYHYHLRVDGADHKGVTGADGKIEAEIESEEGEAELDVWLVTPGDEEKGLHSWTVTYGFLDPVETPEGVQVRLENAGYDVGANDGDIGPRTKRELHTFQTREGLVVDGKAEGDTTASVRDLNEGT